MPDRLASHIVNAVIEALVEYRCLDAVYSDIGTTNLNNATDAAIEEVEKLLRQD
jgi:ribosomal protein L20A (L18A)